MVEQGRHYLPWPMKIDPPVALVCSGLWMLAGCTSVDLASLKQEVASQQPVTSATAPAAEAPATVLQQSQAPQRTGKEATQRKPRRAPPVLLEQPPVKTPALPQVPVPVMPEAKPLGPQAPAAITSCDQGGCWGSGTRYQGSGAVYLDGNGRTCHRSGTWMQCF